VRAKVIANKANQQKAAALRHRLRLLLSESVAESERQREPAAARAVESEALALVEDCRRHEAVMRAEMSAASSLADERPHHEIASPNLFDAARARIQATCDLLAAPLDALLADFVRKDIEEGARTTPLVGAPSLPSTVDQAAARTIFLWLWLHRRLLLVRINHRTLQPQQRDAALARLCYEQDCCPPTPNAGGSSYASFDHVGASDLTLSLGGVINYTLLDGTASSLPPTLYFSW
jgi:hypothetical protein